MRDYFTETERIGFSEWTEDDLPLADFLWGEEDVARYICAAGKFTEIDIQNRLSLEISNQRRFHVQYWPIFERATGAFIGCCGLRPFVGEDGCYEIGVHLRNEFWGQGFAFEAAQEIIKYCFIELQADKLYAGHHPHNKRSQKLLTRLGFSYIGDRFYEPTGLYHPSYEVSNQNK